jgi:hypothetical protein
MPTGPALELVDDLRASWRFLAVAAVLGALAGAAGELARPARSTATAVLLASAHTPDPDGFRRRPISVAELQAHLDAELLAQAAQSAHVPPGSFEVEVQARSESGLYDLTAVAADPAVPGPAASAVARALADRLMVLRERKTQDQLDPAAHAAAAAAREKAAEAYLRDVAAGGAETAGAGAERAKAMAAREGLRLALDRAEARLQAEEQVLARTRASALALEPAAEVYAAGGPTSARPRHPVRGAVTGACAAAFVVLAFVLLLGRPRRPALREVPPPGRAAAS